MARGHSDLHRRHLHHRISTALVSMDAPSRTVVCWKGGGLASGTEFIENLSRREDLEEGLDPLGAMWRPTQFEWCDQIDCGLLARPKRCQLGVARTSLKVAVKVEWDKWRNAVKTSGSDFCPDSAWQAGLVGRLTLEKWPVNLVTWNSLDAGSIPAYQGAVSVAGKRHPLPCQPLFTWQCK